VRENRRPSELNGRKTQDGVFLNLFLAKNPICKSMGWGGGGGFQIVKLGFDTKTRWRGDIIYVHSGSRHILGSENLRLGSYVKYAVTTEGHERRDIWQFTLQKGNRVGVGKGGHKVASQE